ncbi:UNVERIFIED_ORG: hypothetical protein BCL66_105145 [Martelella mediterranea]
MPSLTIGLSLTAVRTPGRTDWWQSPAWQATDRATGQLREPAAVMDFDDGRYALDRSSSTEELIDFSRPGTATYIGSDGIVSSAAADVPRFDYTNKRRQLLLEGPATNLYPGSVDMNANTGGGSGFIGTISRQPGTTIGGLPAIKAIPDAGSALGGRQVRYNAKAPTTKGAYTMSLFAKASGLDRVVLCLLGAGSAVKATFDLVAGTVVDAGAGVVTKIVPVRGGYRLSVSADVSDATSFEYEIYVDDSSESVGDGTSGIEFCGLQFEQGNYTSSYIPTSGSAVTRPADKAKLAGPVAALLRRGAASVSLQGESIYGTGAGSSGCILGGPGSEDYLFMLASNGVQIKAGMPGYVLAYITQPLSKFGVISSWDSLGFSGVSSDNGNVKSGDVPQIADLSSVFIGRNASSIFASGWYEQIVIWPFRVSDTDLQAKAVPYA